MAIFDLALAVLRQRTSMKWTRFAPDVLPMWVAEMDILPPPGVTAAVQHILEIGDMGYPGYDSLPRAFADFAATTWGHTLDAKKLLPCADVVSGMAVLVEAFTPARSSIVINTPIYPPFRVSGAVGERPLVEAGMTPEGGWTSRRSKPPSLRRVSLAICCATRTTRTARCPHLRS